MDISNQLKQRETNIISLQEQIDSLQPKLADANKLGEDMIGQRNHWKRKADSLQQQMTSLLAKLDSSASGGGGGGGSGSGSGDPKSSAAAGKPNGLAPPLNTSGSQSNLNVPSAGGGGGGGVPSTPPPKHSSGVKSSRSNSHDLHGDGASPLPASNGGGGGGGGGGWDERIAKLEREKKEALAAVDAYRKAFDQQLAKNKNQRDSNLYLASSAAAVVANAGVDNYFVQFQEMKKLAQSLSETISDKDLALSHSKTINRELGKRIQELEQLIGSGALKVGAAAAAAAPTPTPTPPKK